MRPTRLIAAVFLVGATLSACSKELQAPTDTGVCWHLATLPNGNVRFNKLAWNQPDMEHCAAQLEGMRLRFSRLGSQQQEMVGAYQGAYLFIDKHGVFTAKRYEGIRYPFMVRTGDGRLAVPGAPQVPE
jgi:hypothetical protein